MRPEAWPKGAVAARCMSLLPPTGTIQHYGRTMAVFSLGEVGANMSEDAKALSESIGERMEALVATIRDDFEKAKEDDDK